MDRFLYIQADTSEKAELIIEKFPEMMEYGNLNLKNFSALTVNCQIDRLSDHFASCPPYVYKFEAGKGGENEIKLFIDTTYISDQEKICEILGNGRFNSVTLLDSDFELNIDIPYSFPNLKTYVVDHQELWTYSDQNVKDETNTIIETSETLQQLNKLTVMFMHYDVLLIIQWIYLSMF